MKFRMEAEGEHGDALSLRRTSRFYSDHAAIGAQHLAVDPRAVRADEEGDGGCDVFGRTEALQRIHLGHALDQLRRFAVEEQIGRGWSGRYGIHSDRTTAQLF